jgi:hypothetical protein
LKFQRLSKLLDSLEGESLGKRMASGLKSTILYFYLRRGLEVPEPIQALGLSEGGVSGKKNGLWLKKHNFFTLREVLKFQRPSKLLDSLEGESLKNSITFLAEKV